ncbi:serine/threonine protein kinase [Campylobacter jejuni]|uniref:serine/threonine protein kinase n=1 Tax=Campylobacter jejuni TaxID=197 RepID=UPI00127F9FE4|nr:serine/threonine protein kinase [Campylobacter coli]EAJ5161011.1 serine/threonine protein kinase [Campylobacter jejuni]EAI1053689.1 serine/threonine protein kinase [Campylobacter coli]EAK0754692.1 serine/threonine protein kinase [Campylobacter coli]EAK1279976.1 serine/threonine protein kinase [Campylobacter jejuni]
MNTPKWTSHDTRWVLSLFGTAIGAGVLLLPISAGLGGLIPLLVILVLAFPMTYLAHRNLCRFVLSSSNPKDDITFVAESYFGKGGGFLITLLYFFAILPILLVYSANLTTTLLEFLINQFNFNADLTHAARWWVSFLIVGVLVLISILGENVVTKAMSFLVFPFIIFLFIFSLLLIPQWNLSLFANVDFSVISTSNFWVTLWLVIPVMVFSFNHSPIISSLACYCKKEYGGYAEPRARKIISLAIILMVFVVMFFVFSCALTFTPEDFASAKDQNINILTFIANKFPEVSLLAYVGPIVALVAISKSFLGHYLGSQEGLNGILYKASNGRIQGKFAQTLTAIITFAIAWFVAYKNPSVIGIIEAIGGPVLAILLFLMPLYCIYRFDILARFRNKFLDLFILVMGIVAISAAIHDLL